MDWGNQCLKPVVGEVCWCCMTVGRCVLNWLLRTFALSRSFVIGLSFTIRVGMPMYSRLFALMNDQNRFGFF